MRLNTLVVAGAVLAGCGSGVSNNKQLSDLTTEDMQALCEEQEERSFTCEDEFGTITYNFGGDCDFSDTDAVIEWPDSCTATVGDLRDCNDAWIAALEEDPCTDSLPGECAWMLGCFPDE